MSGTKLYHILDQSYKHKLFSKTPIKWYILDYSSLILLSLYRSLRGNAIFDEGGLQSLGLVSKSLRALILSENPLVETTDYRMHVLILLPNLERIDKDPISAEERSEALERIKVQFRNIWFPLWHGQVIFAFCFNGMYVIPGT